LSVLHDRNPLAVLLADGAVRNGYTLRILNKELREREFTLTVQGLNEASLDVVGITPRADGRIVVAVGPDQSRELRALVTARRDIPPVMTDISFLAVDTQSGERAQAPDHFHPFERH
jgi:polyferredoxin